MSIFLEMLTMALLALQSSAFEWDHLFIQVDDPGPVVAAFAEAGFFVLPETSVHEGQGTSSRAVLFDNGYIEFIWVRDTAELQAADSILAKRMNGGSAVGFALRSSGPEGAIPFATRRYRADWMMPSEEIRFASTRESEPVIFFVPASIAFQEAPDGQPVTEMLPHPNGANRVTAAIVPVDGGEASPAFSWLLAEGLVGSTGSAERVLEVQVDGGRLGATLDLTSHVPMRVRY